MWTSLPAFGTAVLAAILVVAAYTFAVSIAAATGRPRLLTAARRGAYGTVAMVGVAILILAYAFVSHDFRLEYVASYSDRSMSTPWLVAALWGGQDGSLLWWLFLTSVFSGGCVYWLRGRYRELQPVVIATFMSVILFVAILMLFAANPFRLLAAGAPIDGKGLNFQLRNFYMIIHPPALYIGFTSCVVPFAFGLAALATGRLTTEWIVATRKWMLFSWLFLSIGNALGMLWAYDELGWGGYWAWDPVENAAFLPWLTASAYLHSVMIQERRGMLKMWNLILICLTFFLTYFGTFLTRSGLIASVHSFARSGIGSFFVWYMGAIIVVCTGLLLYRANKLKSEGYFDALLSREVAFLLNNWALLVILIFMVVATLWPRISEWLLDQKATVGPPFYNTFLAPIGVILVALMGAAPLLGWRKTTPELFRKGFIIPVATAITAGVLHAVIGPKFGYPPFIEIEPLYDGQLGRAMASLSGKLPLITVMLVAFNFAVVIQEFYRGVAARQKKSAQTGESVWKSLVRLVARSRRRYGGYIVHIGIAVMFFGFAGRAWEVDLEKSLSPGESVQIEEYEATYAGTERVTDHEKMMVFAHLDVKRDGKSVGRISPAHFIYTGGMAQQSTEIAMHHTLENDLYVIVGGINPQTKVASFHFHVNPFVSFVWLGVIILIMGASVTMWPDAREQEVGAFAYIRAAGGVATMVMLSMVLALWPSKALGQPAGQQQDMKRTGVVEQNSSVEKGLFKRLLCNCGSCPHEPLATCTCPWAHEARDNLRQQLAANVSVEQIVDEYAKTHGEDNVVLRADRGANRAIWGFPLIMGVAGAGFVINLLRNRKKAADADQAVDAAKNDDDGDTEADDKLEERLDAELRELD